MPVLSESAIAALARAAGWTGSDIPTAVAVAMAESGGKTTASNPSGAKGLWQVMWSLHGFTGDPFDPQTNANAAHQVYVSQGWNAWTTYKSGAYNEFMAGAITASGNTGSSGSNSGGNSSSSSPDTSGATTTFSKATMGGTWLRVGAFLLGSLLLIEGLLRATGQSKTVLKVAKDAALAAE